MVEIPGLAGVNNRDRLAINASGDVAGVHNNKGGDGSAAFIYHLGKIIELLPGGDPTSKIEFVALNDRGDVLLTSKAKYSQKIDGEPYVWHDGNFTLVGPAPKDLRSLMHQHLLYAWSGASVVVSALNNAGQVTGYFGSQAYARGMTTDTRVFLWHNGVFRILPNKQPTTPFPGMSETTGMRPDLDFEPSAMNDSGQIIGVYNFRGGRTRPRGTRAAIWKDGSKHIIEVRSKTDKAYDAPEDLSAPTEELNDLRPVAINDLGQWVGVDVHHVDLGERSLIARACFGSGDDTSAFGDLALPSVTDTPRDRKEADSIQSHAYGINNKSQIVGTVTDARGRQIAYLWQDGKAYNLNDLIGSGSGIHLTQASSINDSGHIVAVGAPDKWNGFAQNVYILSPIKQ